MQSMHGAHAYHAPCIEPSIHNTGRLQQQCHNAEPTPTKLPGHVKELEPVTSFVTTFFLSMLDVLHQQAVIYAFVSFCSPACQVVHLSSPEVLQIVNLESQDDGDISV